MFHFGLHGKGFNCGICMKFSSLVLKSCIYSGHRWTGWKLYITVLWFHSTALGSINFHTYLTCRMSRGGVVVELLASIASCQSSIPGLMDLILKIAIWLKYHRDVNPWWTWGFHGICNKGTPTPVTTWSCPIWDTDMFILRTILYYIRT